VAHGPGKKPLDFGGNPIVFRYGEGWGSDYGYVAPSDTSQHWVVFLPGVC